MDAEAERKLAERLKEERDYLGLSQEQVANALGIPRAAVSAIETGRRKVSGLEVWHDLLPCLVQVRTDSLEPSRSTTRPMFNSFGLPRLCPIMTKSKCFVSWSSFAPRGYPPV